MIVIADTTPIISFIKMSLLHILETMYGEIIIPEAVYDELICNPSMSHEAEIVKECSFLKMKKVENEFAVKILRVQMNLDAGESEAIVLAESLKADVLLIDEKKARNIARKMNVNIVGTLGILLEAKRQKYILELKPYLDTLLDQNIRIGTQLYNEILELAEEKSSDRK